MSDKYLELISKLLRQSEGASTPQEAETFMAKAQELATASSIDLAVARQHQADKEKREAPVQRRISIGDASKKGLKYYVKLFLAIGETNDVTCNIAQNSTYVIAFGFPSDIAVTEMLYASVVTQMIDASDRYIRSGEYKSELVKAPVYTTEWDYWEGRNVRRVTGYKTKSVDGRVARGNFQEAFVHKIKSRLVQARLSAIETIESEEPTDVSSLNLIGAESSTALVLKEKAVEVRSFYNEKSTAKGSWRGSGASSSYSSAARSAGTAAGERARLSASPAIGGSRGALTS